MLDLQQALQKLPILGRYVKSIQELQDEVDYLKSRIDVPDELFDRFQRERITEQYKEAYKESEPLVSICIHTFNRARLLVERSLASVLRQDYKNLEVIVVGDGCSDDTEEQVRRIEDKRVRFVNLDGRGSYPEDPSFRWMVAGTAAVNTCLSLCRGSFITHLDDDDEFSADRITKLVQFMRLNELDFVWHPFLREYSPNRWQLKPAHRFAKNQVTTSSVMYHSWLKAIPWDTEAYRLREPGDWNRFRKFKYLNVKAMRYPESLLKHYKERNQ